MEKKEKLKEAVVRSTKEPDVWYVTYHWESFAYGRILARTGKEAREKAMLPWVNQELDEDTYPTGGRPDVSIESPDGEEFELSEEEIDESMERCE